MNSFRSVSFLFSYCFILCGCATPSKPELGIQTKVGIAVATNDLLYTKDINEQMIGSFTQRLRKETIAGLDQKGIMHSDIPGAAGDAQVAISLTGLQVQGTTSGRATPFSFSAESRAIFIVNYQATLSAPDGHRLFQLEGREKSRLIKACFQNGHVSQSRIAARNTKLRK